MKAAKTSLSGVLVFEPTVFSDERGFFIERWNRERFDEMGLNLDFAQINHSSSDEGILRGLHYQQPKGQGKLVWAVRGKVFDVVVDIRRGSPTFGQHITVELSEHNFQAIWIPSGFAHGFAVLSKRADLMYVTTDHTYDVTFDRAIRWNDPDLAIDWPLDTPVLSDKDAAAPLLRDSLDLPTP